MAIPRLSTRFPREFWVAKLTLFLVGFLSLAGAARIAVPVAVEVFVSGLLRFWTAAQPWLAPPYLFITVHLIILVIWKLSDQMQHHHTTVKAAPLDPSSPLATPLSPASSPASPLHEKHVKAAPLEASSPLELSNHVKVPPFGHSVASQEKQSQISATPALTLQESHVKVTPFDPSLLAAPELQPSTSPTGFEIKTNVAEPTTAMVVDSAMVAAVELENESMEATWKAIMDAKTVETTRTTTVAEDSDELHRRCDDFIKKKYDQMRVEAAAAIASRY